MPVYIASLSFLSFMYSTIGFAATTLPQQTFTISAVSAELCSFAVAPTSFSSTITNVSSGQLPYFLNPTASPTVAISCNDNDASISFSIKGSNDNSTGSVRGLAPTTTGNTASPISYITTLPTSAQSNAYNTCSATGTLWTNSPGGLTNVPLTAANGNLTVTVCSYLTQLPTVADTYRDSLTMTVTY